jgi:GT2 family glycosyltransferase
MTGMAVAVVNYNTREQLRACLATVEGERPCEIVVVDNASSDGSAAMVEAAYPQVVLVANETNRGYGAAANQAIARCGAEYVLLLNSDTRLQPGALRALSAYLDAQPRAAVVGPRLVYPDGSLQASCFPRLSPLQTVLMVSSWGKLVAYIPIVGRRYLPTSPHVDARVVPWVKGAALAIRRGAFEDTRGFDESFFLYCEETDLCYRLARLEWEVHFAPVTTVVHTEGASTSLYRSDMMVTFFASLTHLYRRHHSKVWLAEWLLLMHAVVIGRLVIDGIRLRLTRDERRRAGLEQLVVAWRAILRRGWVRPMALQSPRSGYIALTPGLVRGKESMRGSVSGGG